MVVCARRLAVAAVASHTCLPPSVSVIVTKLVEFTVQTAVRVNEWVPTVSERVDVLVAVEAMSPISRRAAARAEGERRTLQRGVSSVLNES